MPTLAFNKRANFDYEIKDKFEAGIMLLGYEVKAVKTGHIDLKGSYVSLKSQNKTQKTQKIKLPEVYLINAHIPLYKHAGIVKSYNPTRPRKLLVKKKEIKHLIGKKHEQGLTLVPIRMYTKRSLIKLEFGVGKGKKKIDKREDIKKKDIDRRIQSALKIRN